MPTDEVIAKRGDALLELFKEQQPACTLLVSSHVLSLASRVFEAMFNGNFTEGQDLSAPSPKKVALREDNPDSIMLLAKITHMKISDIPETIALTHLADLAIACDTYQCTEAVQSWSRVQVAQRLASPGHPFFEKLIFITYVFDLFHEFEQMRHQKKARISASRQKLFPKKYYELVASTCPHAGHAIKLYLMSLAYAEIPMDNSLAVSKYAECAATLERMVDIVTCTEHDDCAFEQAKDLNQDVATALVAANDHVKPLCLDCMRKRHGIRDVACRLGHGKPRSIPKLEGSRTTQQP
ncbi:hypothetical protein EK21DRAFT_58568 [Setomelanomma holmii]|uniref:BTB domain-containing protein n=1 Tax=Setomelanomma holmii TaxID=210430 RepID=A0A9P4HHL5_9PLEO|nr:hypothetical protein EK21DRAFT_58568 [Setomelanomma holmii]